MYLFYIVHPVREFGRIPFDRRTPRFPYVGPLGASMYRVCVIAVSGSPYHNHRGCWRVSCLFVGGGQQLFGTVVQTVNATGSLSVIDQLLSSIEIRDVITEPSKKYIMIIICSQE